MRWHVRRRLPAPVVNPLPIRPHFNDQEQLAIAHRAAIRASAEIRTALVALAAVEDGRWKDAVGHALIRAHQHLEHTGRVIPSPFLESLYAESATTTGSPERAASAPRP